MKQAERKARRCAACGKLVGTATIVCGGEFPDAPLCAGCGPDGHHSFDDTVAMIRRRNLEVAGCGCQGCGEAIEKLTPERKEKP